MWLAGFRYINIFGPEAQYSKNLKGKLQRSVTLFIRFIVFKLYQHQGYVAPDILSPLLAAVAFK